MRRLTENPCRSWSIDSFFRSGSFVARLQAPYILDTLIVALLCRFFFKIGLDSFLSPLLNSDVSRLRRLVAGLSKRNPWFSRRLVLLRFVIYKVALGQVFSPSTSVFACQYHSANDPHSFNHLLRRWLASEEWRLDCRQGEKFVLFAKHPDLSMWKTASYSMVQYQGQSGRSRKYTKYTYVDQGWVKPCLVKDNFKFSMSMLGLFVCLSVALQPTSGLDRLTVQVCTAHTHTHTHTHTVRLIWPSDHLVAEAATCPKYEFPCPQRDSNPRSQQSSGCRPTP